MNMFKTTLLMTSLLSSRVTFYVLAQTEVALVRLSAVSGTPSVVEDAIAKLAQEKKATSWKITSMRIDSSTHATAILYK